MDKTAQQILAILLGIATICSVLVYSENSAAEQKIKNIETLVQTRDYLSTRISVQESHLMLQEVERHIDSLNSIK